MTSFKEQVKKDIENIFQNQNEFGLTCSWNGQELRYNPDVRVMSQEYETQAVNNDRQVLICDISDLVVIPKVAERVDFNGDLWFVVDVKIQEPFVVVKIERSIS